MAPTSGRSSQRFLRPSALLLVATIIVVIASSTPFARGQTEKRLSSVHHQQQQQQEQYYDSDDGGSEVIKSKIRPDTTYSSHDRQYEKPLSQQHVGKQQQQQDAVGSASTVYGEQYNGGGGGGGMLMQDQPALDEEAQESISSGSVNNHRIPQYTRGGSPVPVDVVEGKNVGNRPVGNHFHPGATVSGGGNPSAGYAVDSAYINPHYSTQDLVQDPNYQLEFKYHDYDKMTKFLRTTSSRFPNLTALYSIGKSVQGARSVHPNLTYRQAPVSGKENLSLVLT